MSFPRAGVIGFPLSHSLSPKLHTRWLRELSMEGEYVKLEVPPEELKYAFQTLPSQGFVGWNVTIPHKEQALILVDEVEESARLIGAVNTVVVRAGKLIGRNTDAYGFMENLKQQSISSWGQVAPKPPASRLALLGDPQTVSQFGDTSLLDNVMVLGAGGAARAVVYGLEQAGAKRITLINRTYARAKALEEELDVKAETWETMSELLPHTTLLVNTTSLGMQGQPPLNVPVAKLPADAVVADIVYKPLMTPLLSAAKARGLITVTGLGMLIHQAIPGFTAWFGRTPPHIDGLEAWLLA